jgi:SAM-dependent methyltransferase
MQRVRDALARRPRGRRLLSHTIYAGSSVHCPACGASFRRFAPENGRPNRTCWRCGARERHRQIALLFQHRRELVRPGQRILHVAPEPALGRLLKSSEPSEYVTADLDTPGVDLHFDLTHAPLPDGSFDSIVCNHVLEHIPDDRAALREIRRLLRTDGWALVMTPIVVDKTIEDPSASPAERLRRFGQDDHVRRYGWDYVDRLRDAGLSVEVVRLEDELPEPDVSRYQLRNLEGFVEPIFLVH